MSGMSMVEGYSPLNTTQARPSRYARLNTMDTGSPYGNHTSVASSTTSLAFSEKTLAPKDPRGSEQAPLVPSDSTNHKYEPEVFLQLYIDALRALQWEIHNAARVYRDCDGRFRDIERHVLNARLIYIHSLHLIDQEHHLARRAMDAQRKVESARSSGKSAYRKVFEKVRHGYREWRLRSDVESDQMYIVALFEKVHQARMMYNQTANEGFCVW